MPETKKVPKKSTTFSDLVSAGSRLIPKFIRGMTMTTTREALEAASGVGKQKRQVEKKKKASTRNSSYARRRRAATKSFDR